MANLFDLSHPIAADRKVLTNICNKGFNKEYVACPVAVYIADEGVSSENRLRLYKENFKAIWGGKIRTSVIFLDAFIYGYVQNYTAYCPKKCCIGGGGEMPVREMN